MKDIVVSYQKKLSDTTSSCKTLGEVLSEIKSNLHKSETQTLQTLYANKEYEIYSFKKKALPIVTFCASFEESNRKKDGLKKYNYIVILDIDKLGQDKIDEVLDAFTKDKYVFAFWKSPSQDGVKGLVSVDYPDSTITNDTIDYNHKRCFKKLKDYFMNKYKIELDNSGSDFTRLCFISYDKDIVIKDRFEKFEILKHEYIEDAPRLFRIKSTSIKDSSNQKFMLCNAIGKNKSKDKTEVKKVIRFLKKNNLSITYSYDEWLKVGFAIANTFTFDIGQTYFIEISKQDNIKFNERECIYLLKDCYLCSRGEINFSTIIHLAQKIGYKNETNKTNWQST